MIRKKRNIKIEAREVEMQERIIEEMKNKTGVKISSMKTNRRGKKVTEIKENLHMNIYQN